jgi:uncharacterized glyoxalase superfamily protein PhnB
LVEGADRLIEFLQQAFGAKEIMRMPGPDGKIGHAEVQIGDSRLMLADCCATMPATPCMIHLYVEGVDAVYRRALQAGAESEREPTDMFYGDRTAGVKDSFGNRWYMATHIEDVPLEELRRRAEAAKGSSEG